MKYSEFDSLKNDMRTLTDAYKIILEHDGDDSLSFKDLHAYVSGLFKIKKDARAFGDIHYYKKICELHDEYMNEVAIPAYYKISRNARTMIGRYLQQESYDSYEESVPEKYTSTELYTV